MKKLIISDSIVIEEIRSDRTAAYKCFFQAALSENEECFRISPEDELNESFPTKDKYDSFTLAAFDGNSIVGVTSFEREGANREKLRHKGLIFRMYVDTEYRKSGIGRKLVAEVLKRVEEIEDIEIIKLTVVSSNQPAKLLYKSFGFKTYGVKPQAIKWKGKYFAEEQMILTKGVIITEERQ